MSTDDHRKTPTILVVDDEPEIRHMIQRFLGREGLSVLGAGSGAAMWRMLEAQRIDLVILDRRLPDRDGLELARELRRRSAMPIIMLTVQGEVSDRVAGLESGADDYLPKPFHPRELLARIRAVLRRNEPDTPERQDRQMQSASRVEFDGWRLDLESRQLFAPDTTLVTLSPSEFELLALFVRHPNRALSRDFLLEQTRGRAATPFDRAVDVHVSHLRRKLEENPKQPKLLKTVRNTGYIFTPTVKRLT